MTVPAVLDGSGVQYLRRSTRFGSADSVSRELLVTSLWATSVVVTVLGALLYISNRADTTRDLEAVTPLMAITYPGIGALIVSRRPRNALGWVLCSATLLGVAFLAEQYATYSLLTRPGSLPGGRYAAWVATWVWVPSLLALRSLVFLVFPTGLQRGLVPRVVGIAACVSLVMATVATATSEGQLPDFPVTNPMELSFIEPEVGKALILLCVLGLGPLSVGLLLTRYWRPRARECDFSWFVAASVLTLLVPMFAIGVSSGALPLSVYHLLASIAALSLPVAILREVTRNGLYEIGVARMSAWITAAMGVLGVGICVGFAYSATTGLGAPLIVATMAAALAVYPAYHWTRRVVQGFVGASRAHATLMRFAGELNNSADPQAVLGAIVATVENVFDVEYVGVAVTDEDGVTIARAMNGKPRHDLAHFPFTYQGLVIGELALAYRNSERARDPADGVLLEYLRSQLGVVLFGVRETVVRQRAKQEAVANLELERLCWRDAVHDIKNTLLGVGTIVGTTRGDLAMVARLRGHGTSVRVVSSDILASVQNELSYIEAQIVDVRKELEGLDPDAKPRTVGELGLLEAIRLRVATFGLRSGAPEVSIDMPDVLSRRISTTVEVRAYLVICHALDNVQRHATNAKTCGVRVELDESYLAFSVADDGEGLPADCVEGQGMSIMRRLATYDPRDEFAIEPRLPQGTVVSCRLWAKGE